MRLKNHLPEAAGGQLIVRTMMRVPSTLLEIELEYATR